MPPRPRPRPSSRPAPAPANPIGDYIARAPKSAQAVLEQVRRAIRQAAPGAEEAISYQIPTFRLNGNLVHFAAWKKHLGFYPGATGIAAFQRELSAYEGNKGSVQFPLDRPMPLGLIKRIVKYRVAQNLQKAPARAPRPPKTRG